VTDVIRLQSLRLCDVSVGVEVACFRRHLARGESAAAARDAPCLVTPASDAAGPCRQWRATRPARERPPPSCAPSRKGLAQPRRTFDPEEADYFYIPAYVTCFFWCARCCGPSCTLPPGSAFAGAQPVPPDLYLLYLYLCFTFTFLYLLARTMTCARGVLVAYRGHPCAWSESALCGPLAVAPTRRPILGWADAPWWYAPTIRESLTNPWAHACCHAGCHACLVLYAATGWGFVRTGCGRRR
jgi:hypothetical protein